MMNMTNVKALEIAINALKEVEGMAEVVDKLDKIKTSYAKKVDYAEKQKEKKKEANNDLKENIKAMLATNDTAIKAVDIAEALDVEKGKVVYQLTQLVKEGTVVKIDGEKRKDPYMYKLA